MRQRTLLFLSVFSLQACGDKETPDPVDTADTEDTDTVEDTGDTIDTGDTEDTDTEDTDTEDTDTDDTDTDDTDTDEPDPNDIDDDLDGFSENEGDCDDSDSTFNPDALDDENDGLDQNCDGVIDDGYTAPSIPADSLSVGDIVITEVMQNPCAFDLNANNGSGGCSVDDSVGEWFEVYNSTNTDLDLEGLVVTDEPGSNQDSFTVVGSLMIPAGGYVVFGVSSDPGLNGGMTVDYEFSGMSLGNGSDELILTNASGTLDEIVWDNGSTFPDPTGASMSLDPSMFNINDNDDGANWCEGLTSYSVTIGTISGDLGTPGVMNDACPTQSVSSYATDVAPLMSQYSCSGCHAFQLGSYSALLSAQSNQTNLAWVSPGAPQQSYLFQKIDGTHSSGSLMPKNMPAMAGTDISIIEQWITDGANP
jgi:hypothetical protein